MPGNGREVLAIIDRALGEDLGHGDWTTEAIVPADSRARARVVVKSDGIICGLGLAEQVWHRLGGTVVVNDVARDGVRVRSGQTIARFEGSARALLSGERTVLNLVQRLSGIATMTRAFVDAVAGTGARIADTRKTVPGLRMLDKYAVRVGGGHNHRAGLDGGLLIKENHIALAGSISEAVARARRTAPFSLRLEVEVRTSAEVDEALAAGADIIMLDNMALNDLRREVARIAGRALVEASGNVGRENVRAIAETGVDLISVGALTHSVSAADLSMLIDL